jgi:hypothetical protein
MVVTVKKAVLWHKEIDNRPGMLASTLEPLAEAGADLQVVMGYRYPGERIRPLSSYILFLAGSPQRRQRQPVSPRHQCPPCWSRETIAGE